MLENVEFTFGIAIADHVSSVYIEIGHPLPRRSIVRSSRLSSKRGMGHHVITWIASSIGNLCNAVHDVWPHKLVIGVASWRFLIDDHHPEYMK